MSQYNYITDKVYQGKNQASLTSAKEKNNFKSDAWLTFLQAREKGLKVKKGSTGVSIFKGYQSFTEKDKKDGKMKTTSRPLGFARVFNLDQTEPFKK